MFTRHAKCISQPYLKLRIFNKNRLLPMAKYVRITVVSDGCVFWNLSSCKKSRIKSATRITTLKFCLVWRFKYFGHEWKGFFIGFRTHQILAQNLKQSEASSTIWPKNIKTCLYESKFSLSFFMIFNSKSVNINRDTKLWLKNQGLVKKGFGS